MCKQRRHGEAKNENDTTQNQYANRHFAALSAHHKQQIVCIDKQNGNITSLWLKSKQAKTRPINQKKKKKKITS